MEQLLILIIQNKVYSKCHSDGPFFFGFKDLQEIKK